MSYCVNCGVELDPSAKTCPLCGTPAWHPELDAPPYFPANSAAVQPGLVGSEMCIRDRPYSPPPGERPPFC